MDNPLNNTRSSSCLNAIYHRSQVQQDSTLKLSQDTISGAPANDTIKKTQEGINPLFLMSERKSEEVEAYKEQVSIQKTWAATRVKSTADTTCYICPDTQLITLQSIVESQEPPQQIFNIISLYDKDYYVRELGPSRPVFIETQETTLKDSPINLRTKGLNNELNAADWAIYPLLTLVLFIGFLKAFFSEELSSLFRSTTFFFLAKKLTRENSILWNRMFMMLDFVFFISVPIFVALMLNHSDLGESLDYSLVSILALTFFGLLGFRVLRYFFLKTLGFITQQTTEFSYIYFNQLLYPRAIGVIIVPMLILFAYTNNLFQEIMYYALITTIFIYLILRVFRTFQVFLFKGFSIFYLILYLCALEIIPVLIVFKEIFWE
jgi:hypothetical protein